MTSKNHAIKENSNGDWCMTDETIITQLRLPATSHSTSPSVLSDLVGVSTNGVWPHNFI